MYCKLTEIMRKDSNSILMLLEKRIGRVCSPGARFPNVYNSLKVKLYEQKITHSKYEFRISNIVIVNDD